MAAPQSAGLAFVCLSKLARLKDVLAEQSAWLNKNLAVESESVAFLENVSLKLSLCKKRFQANLFSTERNHYGQPVLTPRSAHKQMNSVGPQLSLNKILNDGIVKKKTFAGVLPSKLTSPAHTLPIKTPHSFREKIPAVSLVNIKTSGFHTERAAGNRPSINSNVKKSFFRPSYKEENTNCFAGVQSFIDSSRKQVESYNLEEINSYCSNTSHEDRVSGKIDIGEMKPFQVLNFNRPKFINKKYIFEHKTANCTERSPKAEYSIGQHLIDTAARKGYSPNVNLSGEASGSFEKEKLSKLKQSLVKKLELNKPRKKIQSFGEGSNFGQTPGGKELTAHLLKKGFTKGHSKKYTMNG